MRLALRLSLAGALLPAAAALAAAQNAPPSPAPRQVFSDTPVFAFAPRPGPEVVKDVDRELDATVNLYLRPNTPAEFHLYVYNPAAGAKKYLVDLRGGPGTALAVRAKTPEIPAGSWGRVRLPSPPPAATPGPAPAAATPPAPQPPGADLGGTGDRSFTLRLLTEDGAEIPAPDGKPYGRHVGVTVRRPDEYVEPSAPTLTRIGRLARVDVAVGPRSTDRRPEFIGAADVRLAFPPELLARGAVVREGFYRRTLTTGPVKLSGAVESPGGELRVAVGVDGFDRAFVYKPGQPGAGGTLIRDPDPAVRVYPAAGFATAAASRPVAGYPVRVEADNAPPDATLELWLRPAGAADPAATEIIRLGGPRDERVWLDPAGGPGRGLLVTNHSRDWVKTIDLAALRGRQEVVAVLTGPRKAFEVRSSLAVAVDATPPEGAEFAPLPAKHVRGRPLPVRASVADPETGVVKAVFFLGPPLDDGTPPPDAVRADGRPAAGRAGSWEAEVPLPADKKGEVVVGVVFTNEAGLSATKTQRVELVDAPAPVGAVDGVVLHGDRPQPGVAVALRAADGKERAATTDARGRFKFEGVPPGGYTAAASRPDSSYGTAGTAPVQVEADRRAKVSVELKKQVK